MDDQLPNSQYQNYISQMNHYNMAQQQQQRRQSQQPQDSSQMMPMSTNLMMHQQQPNMDQHQNSQLFNQYNMYNQNSSVQQLPVQQNQQNNSLLNGSVQQQDQHNQLIAHMEQTNQYFVPTPGTNISEPTQTAVNDVWKKIFEDIKNAPSFRNHDLPLARIKKIMKSDEDVRMISAEAPILFAKACEMFIVELALRSWVHTEESRRRTLQRNDIATAISKSDLFDFLIDIVPRDDGKSSKKEQLNIASMSQNPLFSMQANNDPSNPYLMMMQNQANYNPQQSENIAMNPQMQMILQQQQQQGMNQEYEDDGSEDDEDTNETNEENPSQLNLQGYGGNINNGIQQPMNNNNSQYQGMNMGMNRQMQMMIQQGMNNGNDNNNNNNFIQQMNNQLYGNQQMNNNIHPSQMQGNGNDDPQNNFYGN